jgi:hypothetical protein
MHPGAWLSETPLAQHGKVGSRMTLVTAHRYRDVVLALIALVQCYATRTQEGCAPLSYHATMAECRVLAEDYRRFDSKALARAGIPAVVSYSCVAINR